MIPPDHGASHTRPMSLTWCWWPGWGEQGLAEVFPSLLLGGFWCCFDQGQVLPALLQGLLLGFGIALIAKAGGSVYELQGRKAHRDELLALYHFPTVTA